MPDDRPHGMCHYDGRPVPPAAWPKPARRPATEPVERLESPPPVGRTPEGSEALSGGPIPGPGSRTDDRLPLLPELTCPAGYTGPLPEIPPECYGPDAVPLEPAPLLDLQPRRPHHRRTEARVTCR